MDLLTIGLPILLGALALVYGLMWFFVGHELGWRKRK